MPRNLYPDDSALSHEGPGPVGVLLANLGTPDAPTPGALRRYLREFLSDPRVIEYNRVGWWLILHLFVLPFRPRKSAELYRKIWTSEGSPILLISRRQAEAVRERLQAELSQPVHVALGMRYGNPSLGSALRELKEKGCRRILFLPLYPQYSASTTASTFDALWEELATWRYVPEVRTINAYHDEPGYVEALAASIREAWDEHGEPDKLLFSYHGIPQRYADAGDPYFEHCHETSRLTAQALGLPEDRYLVTFQSLFGREEWIKPYTDVTIKSLPSEGVERLHVVCPGFSADCLETLEEIDGLNREFWEEAGGAHEGYHYIPALNDRADHVRFLVDLLERHLGGWVDTGREPETPVRVDVREADGR